MSAVPAARPAARERAAAHAAAVDAVVIAILLIGAVLMLMPFVWMFSTSLRDAGESFSIPPRWLPSRIHFENYQAVMDQLPFAQFALNSLKIATVITLGSWRPARWPPSPSRGCASRGATPSSSSCFRP